MKKRSVSVLISTILLFLVTILAITGIIKMPLLGKILGHGWSVPKLITKIHTISGVLMTIFTILHVWLYFKVFKSGLKHLYTIAKKEE